MPETSAEELRDQLVQHLVDTGAIRTAAVERAFRAVPRHVFLPGVELASVYRDQAVVTHWDADGRPTSSSSQPAIMAIMLEQLGLGPGQRVLEVGAGTGYNAALMAQLTGPTGTVVTMDIDEEVASAARGHLDEAGCQQVRVVTGDGALGWLEGAPYDRVILAVGAWDLAPAWWEQLAGDGRLVLPLSLQGMQRSVAFDRWGDHYASVSIVDCGFMPMRGCLAGPAPERVLDDRPGVFLQSGSGRPLDTKALSAALGQPGRLVPTGLRVSADDIMGGLGLWLMLHETGAGLLAALGAAVDEGVVPAVVSFPGMAHTIVLAGQDSLAALAYWDSGPGNSEGAFELGVLAFGPEGETLAGQLASAARDWDGQGRRSTDQLSILAYPQGVTPRGPAAVIIDKTHSRLILNWDQDTA
ncbi:MAG TPA: methyltransferase, FxLD system [Streptosporangiaceae bacterium]|nr:methyltransferase, FxLD system [Streptosporangiaceae bacterium]